MYISLNKFEEPKIAVETELEIDGESVAIYLGNTYISLTPSEAERLLSELKTLLEDK